jgi:hypothetical protein
MDIDIIICEEDSPYINVVLFDPSDVELSCDSEDSPIDGEYYLTSDGNEYHAFVVPDTMKCMKTIAFTGTTLRTVSGDGDPNKVYANTFYMKCRDLTEGGDWGGIKVEVNFDNGVVISQEEAMTLDEAEKQLLLDKLDLGQYADDIEFISQEEYDRDYGKEMEEGKDD